MLEFNIFTFLTILLYTIFIVKVESNFVCPDRPILAHYPDPQNCKGYIYCVRGTAFPTSCPGNRYWNSRTKRCDESPNVDCKGVATLPKPIPAQAVPSIQGSDVTAQASTERPVLPPPTVLNPVSETPIPSENKPTIHESSPVKQESPIIATNPLPGKFRHSFSCENQPCGIYPNVNDCSSFILCSNGTEILKHCNNGQLFDTESQECQPATIARCWEEPVAEPLEQIPDLNRNLCSFHKKSSLSNSSIAEEKILTSPVITNWGIWEDWKFCPSNSYVNGIYVWRQLVQSGSTIDQAGVASVSLNCASANGDKVGNLISIAAGAPDEGWPAHYTCSGTGIGFQMNSQSDQGAQDDLATDNLEIICSCGPSVHKPYEDQTGIQSGNRGAWTGENICLPKQAICGMQTQMQAFNSHAYDNTGLNNFNVKCCNVPNPVKSCNPVETMKLIRKCSNVNGNFHRRCDFRSSVGLSYDYSSNINALNFYESIGYNLNDTYPDLKNFFKISLGKPNENKTSIYNWEMSPENIWYEESTSVKSLYIAVNTTTEIYQIVGKCSIYEIKTNMIVKIDVNTRGDSEKTYYQI